MLQWTAGCGQSQVFVSRTWHCQSGRQLLLPCSAGPNQAYKRRPTAAWVGAFPLCHSRRATVLLTRVGHSIGDAGVRDKRLVRTKS